MRYIIENDILKVEIDSFGAEIKSVVSKSNNREYMWCADSSFWGRTSPVLFPFVGSLKDKQYTYLGKSYAMGQHGFARDMEHSMISAEKDEIWFSLISTNETFEKYPFHFELNIGYRLVGNKLMVCWKVANKSAEDMYFSIGAHPAFNCGGENEASAYTKEGYKLLFNSKSDTLKYRLLDVTCGLIEKPSYELSIDNGYASITKEMFDKDALVFENNQATEISLVDASGKPYVTVKFDSPLFGIWSPAGKNAPFVCIEPWYGRCDATQFEGELSEREYQNVLGANEVFEKMYEIQFL